MNSNEDQEQTLARFKEGPALLEQAVLGLRVNELDAKPSAGGWTLREIIHHIADGDDIWKMCIKMALGNDQAEFALGWYGAFPQVTWGERWAYGHRSIDISLALIKANREYLLQLLESIPDAWNRSVNVRLPKGDVERVSVGFIIQMQADHLLHHLARIRSIREENNGRN